MTKYINDHFELHSASRTFIHSRLPPQSTIVSNLSAFHASRYMERVKLCRLREQWPRTKGNGAKRPMVSVTRAILNFNDVVHLYSP